MHSTITENMKTFKQFAIHIYSRLLSKDAKIKFERVIFLIAFVGFFVHIGLIALLHWGIIPSDMGMKGLRNPIDALYTPFSIILFYEVYCLIYYLPKSITIYIGKQFEIITLITIRSVFDEMAGLELSSDVGAMLSQPDFMYSMAVILILYALIFVFYRINQRNIRKENNSPAVPANLTGKTRNYLYAKKLLAMCVGIIFIALALVGMAEWIMENHSLVELVKNSKPATKEFFSNFFTILILNDVVVLLFSFAITDEFPKVMRNSGFVISTILIKLSFGIYGLGSHLLVVMSVVFGTAILAMYKLYDKIEIPED